MSDEVAVAYRVAAALDVADVSMNALRNRLQAVGLKVKRHYYYH